MVDNSYRYMALDVDAPLFQYKFEVEHKTSKKNREHIHPKLLPVARNPARKNIRSRIRYVVKTVYHDLETNSTDPSTSRYDPSTTAHSGKILRTYTTNIHERGSHNFAENFEPRSRMNMEVY